jgi:hypothetical protein
MAILSGRSWLTKGIWIYLPALHVQGITLFPFVLYKNKELLNSTAFIRHERIHLVQQLEMAIIPFYLLYLGQYGWYRLKGHHHDQAYRNIHFEREAYKNENRPGYLAGRHLWAWKH